MHIYCKNFLYKLHTIYNATHIIILIVGIKNTPSKTPPSLSCQAPPPLNQQTVQVPPFLGNPPSICWFFKTPPIKFGSFSEAQKY